MALTCGACGSGSRSAITRMQRLPVSRIGVGSESLGTYEIYGNIRVRATCVGKGTLAVSMYGTAEKSRTSGSCLGPNEIALIEGTLTGSGCRCSNDLGRATITVRAPAHMKWWLDVVDRVPDGS